MLQTSLEQELGSRSCNQISIFDAQIEQRLIECSRESRSEIVAAQTTLSGAIASGGLHFEGRPYPVSLRPLAIAESRAKSISLAVERIVQILDEVAVWYREVPQVRCQFPAYESVAKYANATPSIRPLTRICRFDGILADDGRYLILETNTDCPGGVIQSGLATKIWSQVEGLLLTGLGLDIQPQPFVEDPNCFLQELISSHRALRGKDPVRGCVVNFRGRFTNEIDRIAAGLTHLGVESEPVDAARLRRCGRALVDGAGRLIDLAYNKWDLRDFIAQPEVDDYLIAIAEDEVVSLNPLIGQWVLADKAVLGVLSDPDLTQSLSKSDQELLAAHIPWTRVLIGGRTKARDGSSIDLLSYAIQNRTSLVLKPSNATRGEGVMIGPATEQQAWESELRRAVKSNLFVVQEYVRPPQIMATSPGTGEIEPMGAGLDVYVFGGRVAGFHARASLDPVMNIGKRGTLLPVIVVRDGQR